MIGVRDRVRPGFVPSQAVGVRVGVGVCIFPGGRSELGLGLGLCTVLSQLVGDRDIGLGLRGRREDD